jgi:hypothetical protein
MRRAVGLCIHLAHVGLLLIAALGESRVRRSARMEIEPDLANEGLTAIAGAPQCSMPIWRPDPNVRYAALAIHVDPPAHDAATSRAAPCVNEYDRSAAYP